MIERQIQAPAEDIANIQKIDASIEHWSVQQVLHQLKADELKGNVRSLYLARQQIIEKIYTASGVNVSDIAKAEFLENGQINLVMVDKASESQSG